MQVFLFEEELDDQLVETCVEVPVEGSQVVAGDVVAKVGEFDTLPFPLAPSFPFHASAEDLARDQLHPLELCHELGIEQRLKGRSGGHGVQSYSFVRGEPTNRLGERSVYPANKTSTAIRNVSPTTHAIHPPGEVTRRW